MPIVVLPVTTITIIHTVLMPVVLTTTILILEHIVLTQLMAGIAQAVRHIHTCAILLKGAAILGRMHGACHLIVQVDLEQLPITPVETRTLE
jgi:hypothetical protein